MIDSLQSLPQHYRSCQPSITSLAFSCDISIWYCGFKVIWAPDYNLLSWFRSQFFHQSNYRHIIQEEHVLSVWVMTLSVEKLTALYLELYLWVRFACVHFHIQVAFIWRTVLGTLPRYVLRSLYHKSILCCTWENPNVTEEIASWTTEISKLKSCPPTSKKSCSLNGFYAC